MVNRAYDKINSSGEIKVIGLDGARCWLYVDSRTNDLCILGESELREFSESLGIRDIPHFFKSKNERTRERAIFPPAIETEIRDGRIHIPGYLLERAGLQPGDSLRPSYNYFFLSLEKVSEN